MFRHIGKYDSETWRNLPWKKFRKDLFRLQKRVWKAVRAGDDTVDELNKRDRLANIIRESSNSLRVLSQRSKLRSLSTFKIDY